MSKPSVALFDFAEERPEAVGSVLDGSEPKLGNVMMLLVLPPLMLTPGTAELPTQRKRIFAAALKRLNTELRRVHNLTARTAHVEAARKALALRRAANFVPYPPAGSTSNEGMAPRSSMRRRKIVTGAKIGRVSQATKVAQAIRDARGA